MSEPNERGEATSKVVGLRKKVAVLSVGINICGTTKKVSSDSLGTEEVAVNAGETNLVSDRFDNKMAGTSTQKATAEPVVKSNRVTQNGRKKSYTVSMFALKCQGKSFAFTQLPWVIPSLRPELVGADIAIEDFSPCLLTTLDSIYQQPDTPPPKLLSFMNCV